MAIVFEEIPANNRVPATYVEIDASRALSVQPGELHRVLMIGVMAAGAPATANIVVPVEGELGGDALFGTSSQLAGMCRAFKQINRTARLYALPVAAPAGGTAATSTVTLTGTSTEQSLLTLRVGDIRAQASIATGTAAAAAATALAAAVNAEPRMPVSAAAAGGVVTLTAKQAGVDGNAYTNAIETTVAGLTAATTSPSNGAAVAAITTALLNIGDIRYDTFCTGVADATALSALVAELNRRWAPTVKLPGHIIAAVRGTLSELTTFGNTLNSQRLTVMGTGQSPTPPWIWAAQVAARDAQQTDAQPNRPRNGLTLPACEAPPPEAAFDAEERNALLYDGISTFKVNGRNETMIERLITTYQVNAGGNADATYLSIETVRNLADTYLEFLTLGDKHQRSLLGPDDAQVDPGVPLVQPSTMRGEVIAIYNSRIRRGLAHSLEAFEEDLVVEIDPVDPERMNIHAVPRFINGLVTLAIKLSFQLG